MSGKLLFETNHSKWSAISHGPVSWRMLALKDKIYIIVVLEGCITQIFTCTALTLNGLQKISRIPMPCDNEGLDTCYVRNYGDET